MADEKKNEKHFIDSIQILRIICALSVILFHAGVIRATIPFYVDIFFIISAFLMMMSTEKKHSFSLFRRIMRIAPLYWFLTLFTFILLLWKPSLSSMSVATLDSLVKSIFFIPINDSGNLRFPVICVGWTVNYEIFFSIIFYIAVLLSLKFRGLIVSIICIIGFMISKYFSIGNFYLSYWFDSVIIDFVLGIIAYYLLIPSGLKPASKVEKSFCVILSIALFAVLFSEITFSLSNERAITVGIPCFILFITVYRAFEGIKLPKILAIIGSISYSVYLVEYFSTALFKLFNFTNPIIYWIGIIIMIVGTYFISYFLWLYIEKKLFDKIMSLKQNKKA